jgi:hypothetical protein
LQEESATQKAQSAKQKDTYLFILQK